MKGFDAAQSAYNHMNQPEWDEHICPVCEVSGADCICDDIDPGYNGILVEG